MLLRETALGVFINKVNQPPLMSKIRYATLFIAIFSAAVYIFPWTESRRLSRLVGYHFTDCSVERIYTDRSCKDSVYIFKVSRGHAPNEYVKSIMSRAKINHSAIRIHDIWLLPPVVQTTVNGAIISIGECDANWIYIAYEGY